MGDAEKPQAERLPGGFISTVHRDGDRVRRSPSSDYVRRLLEYLQERQWPHAPRLISTGPGEDVLSFVPGQVALTPAEQELVAGDGALSGVARLTRELHDLTAGTGFAGSLEVACHHDLDPRNTIYSVDTAGAWEPVAFVDWDLAAPGLRVHDLARVCWMFTRIGPGADVARSRARIAVVVQAYGFDGTVDDVLDAILWWQDRCWRGIDAEAAAGDPAKIALRETGVVDAVRATYAWTREHREALR
jgi:hypothetical protein